MQIPDSIRTLAEELIEDRGIVAVVVGGSRAAGTADERSDWDLGVYYQSPARFDAVRRHGELNPPGSWGRLMNGGAWLDVDGMRVDVLLRDIDVVAHWSNEAIEGRFEVDGLLGYLAGLPTYSLAAEVAFARPLLGESPAAIEFPARLAEGAPSRWRFCRDFSLRYAASYASRGSVAGAVGHAARAVIEEGHARACEQRRWVLNEKRLTTVTGLDEASAALSAPGSTAEELNATLTAVARALAGTPFRN